MGETEKNEEQLLVTDARSMKAGDVQKCIADVKAAADKAVRALACVDLGYGYDEAVSAINQFTEIMLNGPQADFVRQNRWLKTKQGEYLSESGESSSEQTYEDKSAVVALFNAVTQKATLISNTCAFLNTYAGELMKAHLRMRLFGNKMYEYEKNYGPGLGTCFYSFEQIFEKYNHDSIYDTIPVSKTKYTYEENYKIVLQYLDDDIGKDPFLRQAFDPGQVNMLYSIDRDTNGFVPYYAYIDKFREVYANAEEFCNLLKKNQETYSEVGDYFGAVNRVVSIVSNYSKVASEMLTQFKEGRQYTKILKYADNAGKVLTQYLNMSDSNPLVDGTRWGTITKKMKNRLLELAKSVAKCAPE